MACTSENSASERERLLRLGLDLSDTTHAMLNKYLDLLLETNKQFNLTAIRDRDQAWDRLILDSLTLLAGLEQVPPGATLIDVGSGGGLPGIPVAIARPDLKVTLLEATGKKARFLEQCVHELPLANVCVIQQRAETLGQDPLNRQTYDLAVCRAVGAMNCVLEYLLPLVHVGGRVLVMKGPGVEQELQTTGDALSILGAGDMAVFEAYPEDFDRDTVIVSILKDRPTPEAYPRRPGIPKQSPL